MIEIRTLGRPTIRRDGTELSALAAHRHYLALLIYVAMEGPVGRDQLMGLLWPERDAERARHSLSQALYALRRELGEGCVQTVGERVAVTPGTCRVDARAAEESAKARSWERVTSLYDGPFLKGFSLPEAPAFEEWVSSTRTRLAQLAHQAFRSAIQRRRAAGDLAAALGAARRWSNVEPLDDEAQHTLIDLLARTGDRASALEHYDAYRERLAQEVGAAPLPETAALVERIRSGAAVPEAEATEPTRGATGLSAFIRNVRSRRFARVVLVYLGAAWLALQATDILVDREILAIWAFHLVMYLFVIGLPVALVFAWAREGRRLAAGADATAGAAGQPVRAVRPTHVLAVLALEALLLTPTYLLITRGGDRPRPPIEVAGASAPTSIAVLYLDDHSEGGELAHIASSLTEHLIHELAQVERLDVRPRNAVKPYREMGISRDTIAQALQVGTLVEGSVTGTREHARISVQLIDARTMTHMVSSEIDGSADDPFLLLDQVGDSIARLLRERLGVEVRLREWRAGTNSAQAWEYVQRATRFMDNAAQVTADDTAAAARTLELADNLLARAEAADPQWIEPIVQRGWVASQLSIVLGPGRSRDVAKLEEGIAHADRALAMEPADASALELRGILLSALAGETDDPDEAAGLRGEAERELDEALEIDPSRARAWSRLSQVHLSRGHFPAALLAAERAYQEDAFLADARVILYRLCSTALNLKDWDRVARWCSEGRRRYPDRESFVAAELVALAGPEGPAPDVERAWQLQEKQVELSPQEARAVTRAQTLMQVAAALVRGGLRDSARAVIGRARAGLAADDPWTDYYEANARLQLGEREAALRLLAALLAADPGQKDFIASDWWWESLHDDPRFQELVADPDY